MKRIPLNALSDIEVMFFVLDQALYCLGKPPVSLTATALCRALSLHNAQLSYMKLLHVQPEYARYVRRHIIIKVLEYLFAHFPTLVIEQGSRVVLRVKLYKTCGGERLSAYPVGWHPPEQPLRKPQFRQGTTRWFLLYGDRFVKNGG